MSLMRSPTKKIEDFCHTGSGGTPSRSKSEYFEAGTIPWVKSGELKARFVTNTEEAITDSAVENSSVKLVPKGSLLIAMYGATVGEVSELAMDAATNQAICHIIPDPNVCDRGYLFQYLSSIKSELLARRVGGGQPNISQAIIKSLEVPLPPLPEQRRIAAILDKADALRAKRREAIAKLNYMLQSVFLEMFGDPVTNPKEWPETPLSEAVNQGTIVTYGIVQAGEEFSGGTPYIRTGDIAAGEIVEVGLRRTDPVIAKKFSRSRVEAGDIVMSIRATVGTTALVPKSLDGANLTQGTARIAVGEKIARNFALHHLRSAGTQRWIERQVKGATFREITLGRLRELPMMIPPRNLQDKFDLICQHISKNALASQSSSVGLEKLFTSLQQRAFEGKL